MPRLRHLAVATLLALTPASLAAQNPITFTVDVFGGASFAAGDLFDETFPGAAALTLGHKAGFQFGGRFGIWPSRRLGIEAEGAFALADLEVDAVAIGIPDVEPASVDANLFLGSLNLTYVLIDPPLDPVAVFISGGVGLVSRGGDAFDGFEDTSDIAGVLGIGLRYGIARGIRIRADVRDYISSFKEEALNQVFIDNLSVDPGSKLQNDLLISVGAEFLLSGGV